MTVSGPLIHRWTAVAFLVICCASLPLPAQAAPTVSYFYPDAAAASMNIVVTFVGSGFLSTDTVSTSSSDIVVGPTIVTDASGTVVTTPTTGSVLSTVFFIKPSAAPATGIAVTAGGTTAPHPFAIVIPSPDPNVPPAGSGILTDRTKRGTSVLGGLSVAAGGTLSIGTADTDPTTTGNQGYIPAVILVKGDVDIAGTLNVTGGNGADGGPTNQGGEGGDGGPGGGGGGGAGVGEHFGPPVELAAPGGKGYTGGGGGGSKDNGTGGAGGDGTGGIGQSPSGTTGGGGAGSLTGAAGGGGAPADPDHGGGSGGGGGTGNPFGAGGGGAPGGGGNDGGNGGTGGGGGGAMSDTPGGGGGGGFATPGQDASDADDFGKGGLVYGSDQLVPLTGGSGGGGGAPDQGGPDRRRGGGGGGGGGALLIYATGSITTAGTLTAAGGKGGDGLISGSDGSSGGGGGSGGAIFVQSGLVTASGTLTTAGGAGGTSTGSAGGGTGGSGRIRIDGLAAGVTTPGTAGSKFIGPAIDTLVDRTVKGRADGDSTVTLYFYDQTGAQVTGSPYTTTASGSSGTVGTWTITNVTFPGGIGYLAVKQSTSGGTVQVFGCGRATRGVHLIQWREVY